MSNQRLNLLGDAVFYLFDVLEEEFRNAAIHETRACLLHLERAKHFALYSHAGQIFDFDSTEKLIRHLAELLEANVQSEK